MKIIEQRIDPTVQLEGVVSNQGPGPVVFSRHVGRALVIAFALATGLHTVVTGQQAGTNVNMVKGFDTPFGDPYLQRQTEPTMAVSTRNPCHLVGSAVDYRTVDYRENTEDTNPTPARRVRSAGAWRRGT